MGDIIFLPLAFERVKFVESILCGRSEELNLFEFIIFLTVVERLLISIGRDELFSPSNNLITLDRNYFNFAGT